MTQTKGRRLHETEAPPLKKLDERIYCTLQTLHLKGKNDEEPLSSAVDVRFYTNKVKDKQETQVTHTYNLIEAKSFMEATK